MRMVTYRNQTFPIPRDVVAEGKVAVEAYVAEKIALVDRTLDEDKAKSSQKKSKKLTSPMEDEA